MKKLSVLLLMALLVCSLAGATPFLDTAKATGITIQENNGVIIWTGNYGGQVKPNGPLAGKTIGLIVGCEFSDWQAYYLSEFIPEFGGKVQFVMNNNSLWKETRPARESDQPHGQWGLSLTSGMDGLGLNGGRVLYPVVMVKSDNPKLKVANPKDYDAIINLGGHSGDMNVADDVACKFIKDCADRGIPVAGIGGGIMPMIHLGLVDRKNVTGNSSVDYMLKVIANYEGDQPVVTDGKIITARDTIDTAKLLRALCKQFDPSFVDKRENILKGKKILTMVTSDWEDVEMTAPILEMLYRGAALEVGLFDPQFISKPVAPLSDYRQGSYGTSVPFQEIPLSYYKIVKQGHIPMGSFDIVWIPGAFNPGRSSRIPQPWTSSRTRTRTASLFPPSATDRFPLLRRAS